MDNYRPAFLLRNGHINTVYTALNRKTAELSFHRERITTHDEDFLDLDWIRGGSRKVVILCHGLEGSSDSTYIQGSGDLLIKNGFDICAMNYRFCSGEINKTPQLYHSGWTIDLHTVVSHTEKSYEEIYLLGFSLGGNLVLKYAGEALFERSEKLLGVAAISTPLNLLSSSLQMLRLENRIYSKRFLRTLNEKVRMKHQQFPDLFNLSHISKIKTVLDFDDYYTGPLNGYIDARDYYAQCSADQFLPNVEVQTLIINAKDDPFLGPDCFVASSQVNSSKVKLCYTNYGGHVGFYYGDNKCWTEGKVLRFFQEVGTGT